MSNPNYPEGVKEKDIDNDNDWIFCDCGGDLKSSIVGLNWVLACRDCGRKK